MQKHSFWVKGKKITSLLMMSVFVVTLFSGCRTKCIEGSDNYPACLGGDGVAIEKEEVNLTFWNLYDDKKAFEGAIQRFEKRDFGNKKVRITYKSFSNEKKYEEMLINEMAEGNGPDIFAMHYSWLPRHKNKIEPMPVELEAILSPQTLRDTFYDVAANAVIQNNPEFDMEMIYAIPLYIDTLGLYYNKKLFKLLTKKQKPAETWEEIKAQVVEIKNEDTSQLERFERTGIAMGRADNIRHAVDILSLLFLQEGVKLFDEKMTKSILTKMKGISDSNGKRKSAALQALDLYKSFEVGSISIQENWNQFITGLYPKEKDLGAFVRGKTAMIFGYSPMYEELKDLIEAHKKGGDKTTINFSDIGVAEVPQFIAKDNRDDDEFPINLADFYPLTVSRNSIDSTIAWEFLLELGTDQEAFLPHYYDVTHKPTAIFEGIADKQKGDKTYGVFARQIQTSQTLPMLNKNEYNTILSYAISKARKKGLTYVLKTAEKQLQCVLNQVMKNTKTPDVDCTSVR